MLPCQIIRILNMTSSDYSGTRIIEFWATGRIHLTTEPCTFLFSYNTPACIRMREIFAAFARASLSRIFLAPDQYSPYGINKTCANQFIAGSSGNKVVANNCWFTGIFAYMKIILKIKSYKL